MKHLIFFLVFSVLTGQNYAQSYSREDITRAAQTFMKTGNPASVLRSTDPITSADNRPVAYLYRFSPQGFVIVSTNPLIRPVYGFSFTDNFTTSEEQIRMAINIFRFDIQNRILQAENYSPAVLREISDEWDRFIGGKLRYNPFQQWPPEGTTSTGGWLNTNWTQSYPYNSMCPMDLNAGSRSLAGCPATAMAQIVNYHEQTNATQLTSNDDYFHNYGSNNQYWIDDDHVTWQFPSFDSLNTWLTSLQYAYDAQLPVSGQMKAALTFACGVAAHSVYSASMSGTFGIDQAYQAIQRFSYTESRLMYPEDTNFNFDIAENMKVALPAQLGLLVAPPGSGGHNLVVDGYNTDEFYHFNFGWGGSSNGWYTLPPTNIAYNLTILEGVVLDIKSDHYTGIFHGSEGAKPGSPYPNPFRNELTISVNEPGSFHLYDMTGRIVYSTTLSSGKTHLKCATIPSGIYFYTITGDNDVISFGKTIKL